MKKNKLIYTLVCTAMVLSMISISVSAAEPESSQVTEEYNSIIETNEAFIEASFENKLDNAINNNAPQYKGNTIETHNVDEDIEICTYIIQDEVLATDNATNSEVHAITYASALIPTRAGGHKYEEDWDGSYYVKAYSTLYYSTQNHDGNTLYCLTKVSGGYSKDVGVSISSQHVVYGMSGIGVGGAVNINGEKYPAGTTFTYNTGFSKHVTTASSSYIGCTYTLTVKRGTGNYNFSLYNSL